MSIFGRFNSPHSLQCVGTGNHFSFVFCFFNLGLLQYCILIIYVMKSLLFPCAYMVVYVYDFQCKKKNLS